MKRRKKKASPPYLNSFPKVKNNPVLAEALLMDLLQRRQLKEDEENENENDDSLASKKKRRKSSTSDIVTTDHFNAVMDMYIRDPNRKDGTQQAMRLFYFLLDLYYEIDDQMEVLQPDFYTYKILIVALTKDEKNPERAKEVLQLMVKDRLRLYDDLPLDNNTIRWNSTEYRSSKIPFPRKDFYNKILHLYAHQSSSKYKIDDPDSPAVRAEGFLLWLEDKQNRYRPYMPFKSKLNSMSYAYVIRAWIFQAMHTKDRNNGEFSSDAVLRAIHILKRMKTMYELEDRPESLAGIPDEPTYKLLLYPFVRMGDGHKAENILNLCIDTYLRASESEDRDTNLYVAEPSLRLFSMVIDAWVRSSDEDAAERAENALRRLIECYDSGRFYNLEPPNVAQYKAVILEWSHSQDPRGPTRALEILNAMKSRATTSRERFPADFRMYSHIMAAFGRRGQVEQVDKVFEMSVRDFEDGNEVARANDHSLTPYIDMMITAQNELLQKKPSAESDFDCGDEDFSWCSPERAEALIERVESMYPHGEKFKRPSQAYASLCVLYARSQREDGPERARRILLKTQDLYESGDYSFWVLPKIYTFNCVLTSLCKNKRLSDAMDLLEYMKYLSDSGKNTLAKPNVHSYKLLINGHLADETMNRKHCADRAYSLLRTAILLDRKSIDLAERNFVPVIICYGRAAAGTQDRSPDRSLTLECLKKAEGILDEMIRLSRKNRNVKPTERTFIAILKAYSYSKNLTEEDNVEERVKRIISLMRKTNVKQNDIIRTLISKVMNRHGSNTGKKRIRSMPRDRMGTGKSS